MAKRRVWWIGLAALAAFGCTQTDNEKSSPRERDARVGDPDVGSVADSGSDRGDRDASRPALATPGGLAAVALSPGVVRLTWTALPARAGADSWAGVAIARQATGGRWEIVGSAPWEETSFLDSAWTTPGTTYAYKLYSYILLPDRCTGPTCPFEESAYSGTASATTPAASRPTAPSALSATAVSGWVVKLTWTDNASNEDGFQVERSTDGATFVALESTGPDVTTYSDFGAEAGTTLHYRVAAFNAAGSSTPAAPMTLTTPALTPVQPSLSVATDTTWRPEDGAFLVTGPLVVNSATLTIAPGTQVRFASGAGISLASAGKLVAIGTRDRPIHLDSAHPLDAARASWSGLSPTGAASGASVTLRHAVIEHAAIGVAGNGAETEYAIQDCLFRNNAAGLSSFGHIKIPVVRSRFIDNDSGVAYYQYGVVGYSAFVHNTSGIDNASGPIYGCSFLNNTTAAGLAEDGARYSYVDCGAVAGSVGMVVSSGGVGPHPVVANTVRRCDRNIVLASSGSAWERSISGNNFEDAAVWVFDSTAGVNVTATGNWWGTTDAASIASKIRDFYDDNTLGIVSYTPLAAAPFSTAP